MITDSQIKKPNYLQPPADEEEEVGCLPCFSLVSPFSPLIGFSFRFLLPFLLTLFAPLFVILFLQDNYEDEGYEDG